VSDVAAKPFRTQKAWEAWLARNHDRAPEVWVKLAKKGSGIPTITYEEAVESALCYGWIDGLTRGFDDEYYVQRFTPRRAKSNWSTINVAKAEALIASGRMQPAGLREVEAAKADGRWDASRAAGEADRPASRRARGGATR
jgi:uncharacterized protein YdeI (YjbR/CyaY-like superfamily)